MADKLEPGAALGEAEGVSDASSTTCSPLRCLQTKTWDETKALLGQGKKVVAYLTDEENCSQCKLYAPALDEACVRAAGDIDFVQVLCDIKHGVEECRNIFKELAFAGEIGVPTVVCFGPSADGTPLPNYAEVPLTQLLEAEDGVVLNLTDVTENLIRDIEGLGEGDFTQAAADPAALAREAAESAAASAALVTALLADEEAAPEAAPEAAAPEPEPVPAAETAEVAPEPAPAYTGAAPALAPEPVAALEEFEAAAAETDDDLQACNCRCKNCADDEAAAAATADIEGAGFAEGEDDVMDCNCRCKHCAEEEAGLAGAAEDSAFAAEGVADDDDLAACNCRCGDRYAGAEEEAFIEIAATAEADLLACNCRCRSGAEELEGGWGAGGEVEACGAEALPLYEAADDALPDAALAGGDF
eukprot:tig00020723_g13456.t1